MSKAEVRAATQADVACVTRIIHEAFEQYRGVLTPPSGAHAETLETVQRKIGEGGAFVGMMGTLPVGCALWRAEPTYMYLGRLAVLADWRKAGVGMALLEAVESEAREMRLRTMQLGVRLAAIGLQDYYERRGYRVHSYGTHPGFSEPTYVMMRKDLLAQAAGTGV